MENLVIIPSSKAMQEPAISSLGLEDSIASYLDEETLELLLRGRRYFSKYITGDKRVPALELYSGVLYRLVDIDDIVDAYRSNLYDIIIYSPAYGLVHGFEAIRRYIPVDSWRAGRIWGRIGLNRVLQNYIVKRGFNRVYCFATPQSWFKQIYGRALRGLESVEAYVVEPDVCIARGGIPLLSSLGEAFNKLMVENKLPYRTRYCIIRVQKIA